MSLNLNLLQVAMMVVVVVCSDDDDVDDDTGCFLHWASPKKLKYTSMENLG